MENIRIAYLEQKVEARHITTEIVFVWAMTRVATRNKRNANQVLVTLYLPFDII
jgi:hypothetical protein